MDRRRRVGRERGRQDPVAPLRDPESFTEQRLGRGRAGCPFVGPAGRLLDRALEASGIVRSDTYVTNVVKHFK